MEGTGPVPEGRLRFSAEDYNPRWLKLKTGEEVPVLFLQDGTVLIPLYGYVELKIWLEQPGHNDNR